MGFGLATAQAERVVAGGETIEVARARITEGRGDWRSRVVPLGHMTEMIPKPLA
jgi:hypothetical protein